MGAEAEYKMKIVVADDEILARKAIASMLLRSDIPIEIVGEFDSGAQVLDYLNRTDGDVDILITDIRMMDIDRIGDIKVHYGKEIQDTGDPGIWLCRIFLC